MIRHGLFILLTFIIACTFCANAQYANHSVLASGDWWKIEITQNGIHKLTTTQIPQLRGINCHKIAIYGNPNATLSLKNSDPFIDDLKEQAIQVVDNNNNGIFDDNDYILFYAEPANVWRYNNAENFVEYTNNPFAPKNYYFITTTANNGKRLTPQESLTPNQQTISLFTTFLVVENDNTNINKSGQLWVGESFNQVTDLRSWTILSENIENNSTVKIKYGLASISTVSSAFQFEHCDFKHKVLFNPATKYRTGYFNFEAKLPFNNILLYYQPEESQASGYLDYIQANTLNTINHNTSQQIFYNLDQIGPNNCSPISITSNNATIWDVTDSATIVGTGNNLTIKSDKPRVFVAFTPNQAYIPTNITSIPNQDLHGKPNPELVIITNPELRSEAERLAEIHRITDQMEVLVANDYEVYNEYASGRQDPMAIRHLMRTYYKRWENDSTLQQPRFLILMGHGTYDNKNITNINSTYLLTFESKESLAGEADSYCTDDMFAYLQDDEQGKTTESMDIAVGRIPATNLSQATHVVNKIENYLYNADLMSETDNRGDWRNYVTLLADDADPMCQGDTIFAHSSEATALQIKANYPHLNIDRIYADAYTQQSGAIGSYYPEVNNALKKRINYGTLLLNYIGHGSEKYIGTERYMEQSDIEGYTNINKLAFFVTSTCSFGHFDNPALPCGAESFLLAQGGGIGVVSASRPISHVQRFNTAVCINALNPKNSIGEALRLAKNLVASSHSITFFGDPTIKLSQPQNKVIVTKINGHNVTPTSVDTAVVLTEVTIEGEIQNPMGQRIEDFDGVLYPIVFDREVSTHTLANDNPGTEVNFNQQKSILYKGICSISSGCFRYSFVVPRDVAFQYDYGRISHYAHSHNGEQASGYYNKILFGGFNQDADLTESHPNVKLYIGDTNFVDGGITDENPTLLAVIRDTIGINYFGSGLGHDIIAILDENPNDPIILNDFYEQDLSNLNIGQISYQLRDLTPGLHTITLRAWNIYNFSGNDTISFVVKNAKDPELGQLTAYPNPAHNQIALRLPYNGNTSLEQPYLELYNNRGQRVLSQPITLTADSYVMGPITIDMSTMPNGIYIARIVAINGKETLSSTTKIVKM